MYVSLRLGLPTLTFLLKDTILNLSFRYLLVCFNFFSWVSSFVSLVFCFSKLFYFSSLFYSIIIFIWWIPGYFFVWKWCSHSFSHVKLCWNLLKFSKPLHNSSIVIFVSFCFKFENLYIKTSCFVFSFLLLVLFYSFYWSYWWKWILFKFFQVY